MSTLDPIINKYSCLDDIQLMYPETMEVSREEAKRILRRLGKENVLNFLPLNI